jgi:hypothetical protein
MHIHQANIICPRHRRAQNLAPLTHGWIATARTTQILLNWTLSRTSNTMFPNYSSLYYYPYKGTGAVFVAFPFHPFLQPVYNVLLRNKLLDAYKSTKNHFSHHPPDTTIIKFRHWWRKQEEASIICKDNSQLKIANLPDSSRTTLKISLSCCIITEAVSRSELKIPSSWKLNCPQLITSKQVQN